MGGCDGDFGYLHHAFNGSTCNPFRATSIEKIGRFGEFCKRLYRLPRQLQRRFMGQTLTIAAHPAGVTLLHEGHELPYEVMELALWRAQVADRKVLDAQLDRRVRPDPVNKPKATHPWKGKPQPTAQCVPAPS